MGIKGLWKLISENEKDICTEIRHIRGELIVDGYGVLHELYVKHNLDWANGGRYSQQQRVTVEYFEAMITAGVKPIVVVDGGGCMKQHEDTVHRRNKDIVQIPDQLHKQHDKTQASHLLPILAREIFVSSLREKGIDVCVADGKATRTIVRLANYYQCPILTNSSNYCVSGVTGGVIFFKHFDESSCEAIVYEQNRLVEFCSMKNPDLVYVVVAIMGDGSDTSIRYGYHGKVRRTIEAHIIGKVLYGRSQILNIADFLRIKGITSFEHFKCELESFNFGRQYEALLESCQKVEQAYDYSSVDAIGIDELKVSTTMSCSKPSDLPMSVLEAYRNATFPVLALNAMTIGKCVLEQAVGDQEQPSPPMLGCPVRQLVYGLVSGLMNQEGKERILEYHRSSIGSLKYEPHKVTPQCEHKELCVTTIYGLDEEVRRPMAMRAICKVLQFPAEDIAHKLEGYSDKKLLLAVLVTHRWAQYLIEKEPVPNPRQLISALVVNFFLDLSDPGTYRQPSIDETRFSDPYWLKVYHALLEWQSLYSSVCSLNAMLCQPLEPLSPSFLFDGPLVIFLALHPSPDIIDTYVGRLGPEERAQYGDVLDLIIT